MADLISRQAAIDAISCDITVTGRQNAELVAATIGTFADRIKALPSAQPNKEQQKTGEWNGTQNVECDQCGHLYPAFMRLEKYCPNCGARMEVGHE